MIVGSAQRISGRSLLGSSGVCILAAGKSEDILDFRRGFAADCFSGGREFVNVLHVGPADGALLIGLLGWGLRALGRCAKK